jgi:hypothetical protein
LLLTTFGSLQAIREATAEQIGVLPGFSVKSGQRILDALRQSDATAAAPVSGHANEVDTAAQALPAEDPAQPEDGAEQPASPTSEPNDR